MSNPYQSPNPGQNPFGETASGSMPVQPRGPGMVNQILVISILMIVHGGLAVMMGIYFLVMSFVFPMIASAPPNTANGPPPEMMMWIMFGLFFVLGLLTTIGAVLQIYAGIRNLGFQSHTLGMVGLVGGGVATMAGCYCIPTSVALLVYGLIVYLNPEVKLAFQMAERGMSKEQIMASFYSGQAYTQGMK